MPHPGDDDPQDMRISGLTGSKPAPQADPTQGAAASEATEGVLDAQSVSGAATVEGADAVGGPGSTEAIAQALASGAISAEEAKARLIDEAVRSQLPADADPALVESVRAEVEASLYGDPTLARLLSPG